MLPTASYTRSLTPVNINCLDIDVSLPSHRPEPPDPRRDRRDSSGFRPSDALPEIPSVRSVSTCGAPRGRVSSLRIEDDGGKTEQPEKALGPIPLYAGEAEGLERGTVGKCVSAITLRHSRHGYRSQVRTAPEVAGPDIPGGGKNDGGEGFVIGHSTPREEGRL